MAPTERVALVTGGGGGIGRAIALALGSAGHAVAVADLRADQAEAEAIGSRGGERVLVVEDSAPLRRLSVRQLGDLGYAVMEAANGPEALAMLGSGVRVDLLFTDVAMPGGLDGQELAHRAQALRPGLKVLFTSGYTENAIIHHGRLDFGVLLLAKPYRKSELARMIRKALDG